MEKVKVVKPINGILNAGDILVSPILGADFCLSETNVTSNGASERFVSLDYVTVSENIPQFFTFVGPDFEIVFDDEESDECEECDCMCREFERSRDEVDERYGFYSEKFEQAPAGSEAQIVYRNLMWFIEWLYGQANLIK
jgi:hypothetical protein